MTDPLQFPDIPPLTWKTVWPWIWVLFLSGWGGAVHFWQKRRNGQVRPFNVTELVGEMFTSGFAGVLTYLLCSYFNIPAMLSAVMVGVSGHMGARAIFGFERYLARKYPMYGAEQESQPKDHAP